MSEFADTYSLYLDKKGPRPARQGRKVSWTDLNGNRHHLDFVLERGGTATRRGFPVAFIETAWRRYTKHLRNKVQEIQGAIMPLLETHRRYRPFAGAVLAGVFTNGALNQLRSLGFSVVYFPYETVLQSFSTVGIDAGFDEKTPDAASAEKLQRWEALESRNRAKVGRELARRNAHELSPFVEARRSVAMRTVKTVRILPLHGRPVEWTNVEDAIAFIHAYKEEGIALPIACYEVQVIYINGDKISGDFAAKGTAVEFLQSYSALPA